MLTPVIDGIASEYSDKYSIGKVNVDNNSNIAAKYGIRSIPCLLFFKNGEVQEQIVGAVDKEKIVEALEKL
jgi:thioredoxin 1